MLQKGDTVFHPILLEDVTVLELIKLIAHTFEVGLVFQCLHLVLTSLRLKLSFLWTHFWVLSSCFINNIIDLIFRFLRPSSPKSSWVDRTKYWFEWRTSICVIRFLIQPSIFISCTMTAESLALCTWNQFPSSSSWSSCFNRLLLSKQLLQSATALISCSNQLLLSAAP